MSPLDTPENLLIMKVFQEMDRDLAETERGGPVAYIIACARAEAAEAMKALVDINPGASREIMLLQNDIQRHRDILRWLRDAQARGMALYAELDLEEKDSLGDFVREGEYADQVEED